MFLSYDWSFDSKRCTILAVISQKLIVANFNEGMSSTVGGSAYSPTMFPETIQGSNGAQVIVNFVWEYFILRVPEKSKTLIILSPVHSNLSFRSIMHLNCLHDMQRMWGVGRTPHKE